MLSVNSKITFRTNGRGVTRVWKGTVFAIVKSGKLPASKALQACVPHGDKPSNRDRYIVKLDKIGTLAWANALTAVEGGAKLPPHNPRTSVRKPKAKVKVKVKAKAKPVAKVKAKPVAKAKVNAPKPKVVKADKPKTTWYGIVDGKVVAVRKVLCPTGFSKDKPTAPVAQPVAQPAPTPEPAALPQAAV